MFVRLSIVVLGLFASALAVAESATYVVDARHTFPSFEVKHLGFSLQRGRFNDTSGNIVFDSATKKLSVEIAIDANSIDTGLEAMEKHLRNADFLDVEKHPAITFKSTGARFNGDTLVSVDGNLTLRGQTKPVKLTVNAFRCGQHPMSKRPTCGADAETTIKRSDFGITYGLPAVADEVRLLINVEASQP
ncbi:MAG TPA: YceI family protein [Burkholderiales bacterium]|nr:YceI family protein [Burkholderiales bacterium]